MSFRRIYKASHWLSGKEYVYSAGGLQEMGVQCQGWEDPLEEEMAAHSSILVGKFYRQRSLAGYRPRGRKRVRYS